MWSHVFFSRGGLVRSSCPRSPTRRPNRCPGNIGGSTAGPESLESRLTLTANLVGDFGRATLLDDAAGSAFAVDVAVDGSGSRYVVGSLTGSIDMDPSAGTTTLSSAGLGDIFVAKYGPSGSLEWARAVGGAGADQAISVAIDGSGNILVGGAFEAAFDFDPGSGSAPVAATGDSDAFIARFSSAGELAWVRTIGGIGYDSVTGVAIGPDGRVVVSGGFMGTVDFDPGPGTNSRTAVGIAAGFLVSLDAAGGLGWVAAIDGTSAAAVAAVADVAVDGSGGVFAAGSFAGTIDVDSGSTTSFLSSSAGEDRNGFAVQLAANGAFQWARHFRGTSVVPRSVSVDAAGNRFVGGSFIGSATVAAGDASATLQSAASGGRQSAIASKWSADGGLLWVRRIGDAPNTGGGTDNLHNGLLAADGAGGVAVLGTFFGMTDFDPGVGTAERTSVGGYDVYLARLGSTGDLSSIVTIGGSLNDYAGLWGGLAVSAGVITITGTFRGPIDFDPGAAAAVYTPIMADQGYAAILTLGQPPATAPSAASGLIATAGNGRATLSWTAPTSDGGAAISDYRIEFSANGGASWMVWPHAASAGTSTVVTGLTNGIVYRFRVAAVNSVGRGSYSPVGIATPRPQLPASPSITLAVAGPGRATIAWSVPAANGAAIVGYRLQRSSDNGVTWTAATVAPVVGVRAAVLGLINGTRYVFRVAAVNAVGRGPFSENATSFTVTPVGLPGAPRIMSVLPMNGQVNLWWQAPAASGGGIINDYILQRSTDNGKTWVTVTDPVAPALAATVSGLVNGRAYRFRVAAVNAAGRGAFSVMSSRVIPLVPPNS